MMMFDITGGTILLYQPCDLLPGIARDLDQVANNNALTDFVNDGVLEAN